MAKRGKRIYENPPKNATLPQLTEWIHDQMNQNQDQAVIMMSLFCMGVTPEKYKTFYDAVTLTPAGALIKESPEVAQLLAGIGDFEGYEEENIHDMSKKRKAFSIPMKDADNKTLKLKLQLSGITKPPVWREVIVPANFSFKQLHEIIQVVFNWDGSHLWQFEEKAYNSDYVVTESKEDDFDMRHDIFYNPDTTPISSLLKSKGDKLEYLYDFGDDWVVIISVKDILESKINHPEVIKYKGDNMIDDIGGVWGYIDYRDFYSNLDKLSKTDKKDFLERTWFDSEEKFKDFMENLEFDLNYTNNLLKNI